MKKFVVITPGRSGSTHLSETLNRHKNLHLGGELFNRANLSNNSFNSFLKTGRCRRIFSYIFNREKVSHFRGNFVLNHLIRDFLKHYFQQEHAVGCGFKITLDQTCAYPYVIDAIIKQNFKIIYLTRKDHLKLILSLIKARETGQYHTRKEQYTTTKSSFNPTEVVKGLKELKKLEIKTLNQISNNNYLIIKYEDLFKHYSRTIELIIDFLEIDPSCHLQLSSLKKMNSDNLSDWVENIDVIRNAILINSNEEA